MKFSKQSLIDVFSQFQTKRILVVGDLILDKYTHGNVSRISPEAPVPILHVLDTSYKLGGAASTAVMLKYLGCEVTLVGLCGQGANGNKFIELLQDEGLSSEFILKSSEYTTILKERVLATQQQIIRIDYEKTRDISLKLQKKILNSIQENIQSQDALVISDYNKGLLSKNLLAQIIKLAYQNNIPCIVDPASGKPITWVKHATTIKPNRIEASIATGIKLNSKKNILEAAEKIKLMSQVEFVTLSLDKDGILYYKNSTDYFILNEQKVEVYDVTGAGDMVVSILASFLANKINHQAMIKIANIAANMVVAKLGVLYLTQNDLLQKITNDQSAAKIRTLDTLLNESSIKERKQSIFFTNGYFDQFSSELLKFLFELKSLDGIVILAINSDQSIYNQKKKLALLSSDERIKLLSNIESIDFIIVYDDNDASCLIEKIQPDVVVKSSKTSEKDIHEMQSIKKIGAQLKFVEDY